MAKKKSRDTMQATGPMAMEYKPPSPKEQMRQSAEYMANEAVRHHPQVKKIKNQLTTDIHKAVMKTLSGRAKKV